ncbi:MAG: two-component hybrid sensor and regulator [uncultured bacterium]|nr:MAG: two-component hybrid sensor and regulator [uncultured bacterium]
MPSLMLALVLFAIIIAASSTKVTNRPKPDNATSSQQLMTIFFEESTFPTVIFKPDLTIVVTNRSFNSVFMNSPHPLPDKLSMTDIEGLWQDDGSRKLLEAIKSTRSTPSNPLFIDIKLPGAGGTPETYIIVLRSYEHHPGIEAFMTITAVNARHTLHIAEDLTDKLAEKDTNLKKLEEVDRLKSEFLATLSHELKTPLVSIKGYLDLIASEKMGPLTEKQAKALQVSLKNASHLNSLISSILNFARMEAGKLMFDLVHQKLPPRINEIIDSMRPIAENRNITMQASYEKDLPAVVIDPELIHRVMCNLLENSIKFSPTGSSIMIEVSRYSPQLVKVQVIDHGCGIPADKLEIIKTPFYQIAKSDTRPTSGLGLGLAICEKILIGHGTSLHIESCENQGTVCSFYLKIAPESGYSQ